MLWHLSHSVHHHHHHHHHHPEVPELVSSHIATVNFSYFLKSHSKLHISCAPQSYPIKKRKISPERFSDGRYTSPLRRLPVSIHITMYSASSNLSAHAWERLASNVERSRCCYTVLASFPGLPLFCCSSTSMYYC